MVGIVDVHKHGQVTILNLHSTDGQTNEQVKPPNLSVDDDLSGKAQEPKVISRGEELKEEDEPDVAVCCMKGCLAGLTVAVLLLIILPAGILVTVYADGNNDVTFLALGIVLICIPLITFPLLTLCIVKKYYKCLRTSK